VRAELERANLVGSHLERIVVVGSHLERQNVVWPNLEWRWLVGRRMDVFRCTQRAFRDGLGRHNLGRLKGLRVGTSNGARPHKGGD